MIRSTVFLTAVLLVWLSNSSFTESPPAKPSGTDFQQFLGLFSRQEFPASFAADDFNPMEIVADEEGVYVTHEGIPVSDLMIKCKDLMRWYKGKQTHPELLGWLKKYSDSLSVNWYELFPGVRVSTAKLEIISIHNYTGYSTQEGGTTQNWLLYFTKKGKLLKTVKLSDDSFFYGSTMEDNASVSFYCENTEIVTQLFDLCSENELQTVTSTYTSEDYFGTLPRDTAYFREFQSEPVFTATIIELK